MPITSQSGTVLTCSIAGEAATPTALAGAVMTVGGVAVADMVRTTSTLGRR
jgi:hypothetical protein